MRGLLLYLFSMIQAAVTGCFFIPREKLREYENQTVTYNGKTLSYYDATQQQRYIERQIRRWKREYRMMDAAGQDTTQASMKLAQWRAAEKDFCKQTGLDWDSFRSQVEGFGRRQASRATWEAKKHLEKEKQEAIIKEEIRKAGGFSEKAKIHLFPRQMDTDTLGFDEQHINKERKHNITREEAVLWIQNAKISVTVWGGQYERYYGYDGAVYVNVQGRYIRTAYSKNEFQKEVLKIVEVLKKYGY